MIRIGHASIGLVGLDIALNRALADNMTPDDGEEFIYRAVASENYIPTGKEKEYRQALRREYEKLLGIDHDELEGLVIRIFGSGCVSCNALNSLVINAMNRAGVAADIEQIHDRDEIGRAGITATPALMINGEVKSAGVYPTLAQVEEWIGEKRV
ncbi:MAG: thioredoxin family protein [Thermodesulfobacteriota bacterium]